LKSLKKIALLNGVTAGIDYFTRLLISFVLNPIILSNLGAYLFGIWKILGQLNSYLATGDLRAATSLKWIVSKDREVKSNEELSKIYSTAIFSFLLLLPLYIIAGIVIVYLAPFVSNAQEQDIYLVRSTSTVLILTFIVVQFFFLYESLLQAMNMAYKRIGLRSIILILGGIGNVIILKLGYSIFELAIVNFFAMVCNGIAMYVIAKQHIDWLHIVRVKFKDVKGFTGLSLQYTLQKFASLANISSDVILLGYLAGPKYVAQYTFTMFAMLGIKGLVKLISTAVIPGLGKFYGEGNFQKVFTIRNRLIELKRMLLTVCAVLICLFNASFVELWTNDSEQFSSNLDTFLITLVITFRVLAVVDKSFINISLKIKKQIGVSVLTAIFIVVFSIIIIPVFEITGLLLTLLGAAIIEVLLNAVILKKELGAYNLIKDLFYSKSFLISNIFVVGAFVLSYKIFLESWIQLFVYSLIVSLIVLILYWFTALNKEKQKWIYNSILTSLKKK